MMYRHNHTALLRALERLNPVDDAFFIQQIHDFIEESEKVPPQKAYLLNHPVSPEGVTIFGARQ